MRDRFRLLVPRNGDRGFVYPARGTGSRTPGGTHSALESVAIDVVGVNVRIGVHDVRPFGAALQGRYVSNRASQSGSRAYLCTRATTPSRAPRGGVGQRSPLYEYCTNAVVCVRFLR